MAAGGGNTTRGKRRGEVAREGEGRQTEVLSCSTATRQLRRQPSALHWNSKQETEEATTGINICSHFVRLDDSATEGEMPVELFEVTSSRDITELQAPHKSSLTRLEFPDNATAKTQRRWRFRGLD